MIVGVPKEKVAGESRVALVPELVSRLAKVGLEIIVESAAGEDTDRAIDTRFGTCAIIRITAGSACSGAGGRETRRHPIETPRAPAC